MTPTTPPSWFGSGIEETTVLPAVVPAEGGPPESYVWTTSAGTTGTVTPADPEPYAGDDKLAAALAPAAAALASSPSLTPVPEADPAWATDRLTPLAAVLHSLACACLWGGDVEGHGADFEVLAGRVREGVLAEAVPGRGPVEAKVWAGTWGALAATVSLALATLLLDRLDVIWGVLGGQYPWVAGLMLVLSVALPPVAAFLRGYLAVHTPRTLP